MMRDIVLRNFTAYGDARILNQSTGRLSRSRLANPPMHGFFVIARDRYLCVFKQRGALWIQYGANRIPFDTRVSILVRQGSDENTLSISIDGVVVMRLRYVPTRDYPLPEDPAPPFLEPEDLDFGLWLGSLIEDPERQSIVLSVWRGDQNSDAADSQP